MTFRDPRPFAWTALLALSLSAAACATAPSPAPPPPPPKDIAELLDRTVATYGGREALSKVTSYAFAGSLNDKTEFHSTGTGVSFTRTFSLPDRLKVVITRASGSEIRIVDGGRGWRNGRNGGPVEEVTGKPLAGMQLQAARAAIPWILEEKRAQITQAPSLKLAQEKAGVTTYKELWVLDVPLRDDLLLKAIIDPDTGLVLGVGGYLSQKDPGGSNVFETHFDDFNPEAGVLFPRIETSFAGQVNTGLQKITAIKLNPPLSEGEFKP